MAKMNRWKAASLLVIAGVLAASPLGMGSEGQVVGADDKYAVLTGEINEILQDERLNGALAGVSIQKADSGEQIYDHFGDTRLKPASNMKLFTMAAALESLGEDHRFTTEIHTDGQLKGKVLHGNLYLKGKGDPTLLEEDFERFAEQLKSQGIQKVKGDLLGDDSWFDDERLSEDMTWKNEVYYVGAQVSALTASPNADYDAGSIIVEANAGAAAGDEAKVTLAPETDYVTVVNNAKTVAAGEPKTLSITRKHGTNEIVVEGNIPEQGSRTREWIAVHEPSGYALSLFEKALGNAGIDRIGQSATAMGVTPDHSRLLVEHQSMTLAELSLPFMKLSNNGHGEALAKEMGKVINGEGSWTAGIDVMESVSSGLGVNVDTVQLRDASGMSHVNLIPANEISQLLFAAQSEPWFDTFLASLPVAGAAERLVGGTLRNRMKGTAAEGNVQAKTGSLSSVSSLAGYATTKDGDRLIFAIVLNNHLSSVTSIENAIAEAIAGYEAE